MKKFCFFLLFLSLGRIGFAVTPLETTLAGLQVQEASLLSENKALKTEITQLNEDIKKKKKTIVAGAVIGGLTATAGGVGFVVAKSAKDKTALVQNKINAIANRETLIRDILKLSIDLCKTDNVAPCTLMFGIRNLATTETELNLKSDTELSLLKTELSQYDDYEKMIHFMVKEEMCECFKNGTCSQTDDGLKKYDEKVVAYKKQNGSHEAVVREYEKQTKEHDLFEKIGELKTQLGSTACEDFEEVICSSDLATLETAVAALNTCLADAGKTVDGAEVDSGEQIDYVQKILDKKTELENEHGIDPTINLQVSDDTFPMTCRDALSKSFTGNRRKALEKLDGAVLKQCYEYLSGTLEPALKTASDKSIENLKTKLDDCVGTSSDDLCWLEDDILYVGDDRLASDDFLSLVTADYLRKLVDLCCKKNQDSDANSDVEKEKGQGRFKKWFESRNKKVKSGEGNQTKKTKTEVEDNFDNGQIVNDVEEKKVYDEFFVQVVDGSTKNNLVGCNVTIGTESHITSSSQHITFKKVSLDSNIAVSLDGYEERTLSVPENAPYIKVTLQKKVKEETKKEVSDNTTDDHVIPNLRIMVEDSNAPGFPLFEFSVTIGKITKVAPAGRKFIDFENVDEREFMTVSKEGYRETRALAIGLNSEITVKLNKK